MNTFQSLKKRVKGKKIVNKIFYIKGDDIFDVGFRPGVVERSQRFHVKTNPINEEDQNRVQVVVSGTVQSVAAFHEYVRNNDVRIKPTGVMYQVTDLEPYDGEIDWTYENLSSVSYELGKGFRVANTRLAEINQTINQKFDVMDTKFGVIGETLKRIEDKLPDIKKEL